MLKYYEKVMEVIDEITEYPHPQLRLLSISVVEEIANLFHKLYPNNQSPGQNLPLPNEIIHCMDNILPILICRFAEDDDKK